MRIELYVHLMEIFEEERSNGLDEAEAVEAAMERFGDPQDLRSELQKTISKLEQAEGYLDELVCRRDSETPVQHASRLTACYCLVIPIVVPLIIGVWGFLRATSGSAKSFIHMLSDATAYGGPLLACFALQVFVFALIGHAMQRQLRDTRCPPKAIISTVALSLFSSFVILSSGWCLLFALTRDATITAQLLVPTWVIIAGLMPIAVIGFSCARLFELSRVEALRRLPIDE